MKLQSLIAIPFLFLLSTFAFARDPSENCTQVFTELAKSYLSENQDLLSCFEHEAEKRIDIDSLTLSDRSDLDQGSWDQRRVVKLCDKDEHCISLYTIGNLWCSDEKVLGIKTIN